MTSMSRRTTRSANDGGHGGIGQNGDKIPGNPQEPAKVPDRSESDGNRDSRGWFVKGCAPGPGRKPRRSVHEIASELAERDGLPTVKYFADKLCLSSNYFGDMFKKETGKTPQEYIQEKVIELAKERMSDRRETVSRVAYSLGFQYPQHFCRLFKKRVGCTPNEYRTQNLPL